MIRHQMLRASVLVVFVTFFLVLGNQRTGAAEEGGPSQFIRQLGDQAISVLNAEGASLDAREAKFRSLLRQGFDLEFIGRFVLGRHWRKATAAQRNSYLNLFSEYILRTYASRMGGYVGESLVIVSERQAGKKDVMVRTRINRPSGPPIKADWRVRTTNNHYRIIDIMVEGVSMAATQRSEFSSVVKRNGIDGLIQILDMRANRVTATAAVR